MTRWEDIERLRAQLAALWRAYLRGEPVDARYYGILADRYAELRKK